MTNILTKIFSLSLIILFLGIVNTNLAPNGVLSAPVGISSTSISLINQNLDITPTNDNGWVWNTTGGGEIMDISNYIQFKTNNPNETCSVEQTGINITAYAGKAIRFTATIKDDTNFIKLEISINSSGGTGATQSYSSYTDAGPYQTVSVTLDIPVDDTTATLKVKAFSDPNLGFNNRYVKFINARLDVDEGPIVNLDNPGNNTIQSSNTPVKISVTGGNGSLVYNWDNNNNMTVSDTSDLLIPAGDGLHNLSVYVKDSLDNWVTGYYEFTIDDTSPSIILTSPLNESIHKSGTAIQFTITGGDGYLVHNWDNNSNITVTDDTDLNLPFNDGLHNLSVFVKDSLDTWVTRYYEFTTDDTAPIIILDSPTNGSTQQSGVPILFNISGGDGNLVYNWDDNFNTTSTDDFELFLPSGDGLHNLTVYAKDATGNYAIGFFEFTINESISPTTTTNSLTITTSDANFPILAFISICLISIYRKRN